MARDMDVDAAAASTSAAAQAARDRKETLLEFDRAAAKRTTVIDDQADPDPNPNPNPCLLYTSPSPRD